MGWELMMTGKVHYNEAAPPPTAIINGNPIIFEDGIAADTGEPDAVIAAKCMVDEAIIVDQKKNLYRAAPLLLKDLLSVKTDAVVGGTTASTCEALLEHLENNSLESLKWADVIVLFGTEGNINPDVKAFIRAYAADDTYMADIINPLKKSNYN